MSAYIDPRPDAIAAFLRRDRTAPVIMLNLLRFRETADYGAHPDLALLSPTSGREAYAVYLRHTRPFLAKYGAESVVHGRGEAFLIGPDGPAWDAVRVVRYPSVNAFLGLAQDPDYLAGAGHRTAALADSRLLPLDTE